MQICQYILPYVAMTTGCFGIGCYLLIQIGGPASGCILSSGWLCGILTLCVAILNVAACIVRMYQYRHGVLLHRVSLNVAFGYAMLLNIGAEVLVPKGEWFALYVFLFHILFAKDGFWASTVGTSMMSLVGYFVMILRMDQDQMAVACLSAVTYSFVMLLALYGFERESRNLFACTDARLQERKKHKKAIRKEIDLRHRVQNGSDAFHDSFVDYLRLVQSSLESDMVRVLCEHIYISKTDLHICHSVRGSLCFPGADSRVSNEPRLFMRECHAACQSQADCDRSVKWKLSESSLSPESRQFLQPHRHGARHRNCPD